MAVRVRAGRDRRAAASGHFSLSGTAIRTLVAGAGGIAIGIAIARMNRPSKCLHHRRVTLEPIGRLLVRVRRS